MQNPKAILFDADGVVQRVPDIRNELIWESVDKRGSIDQLFDQIIDAVIPCAIGEGDFRVGITDILNRWGSHAAPDDFLKIWCMTEPDREIMALISSLRQKYRVCLASNQEQYKAKYMAGALGYDKVFEKSFYSCELGTAKPGNEFFKAIVRELELLPQEILFIDDHEDNVNAAIQVGICAEVFHVDQGFSTLTDLLKRYEVE